MLLVLALWGVEVLPLLLRVLLHLLLPLQWLLLSWDSLALDLDLLEEDAGKGYFGFAVLAFVAFAAAVAVVFVQLVLAGDGTL
ncbi:hypothetical protein EVAR_67070_1 [Eumeta japonica]|uniref:Uncharacterized protein n=1 Tax=Eumeta variegata TaxID=151549 RepID=A0A4C2AFR5_EUMVA|nr:hypothetical protein EVAR_67070_1 [Eumeta japonica]